MRADLLLLLAAKLDQVARDRAPFDMGEWRFPECATPACALGHATAVPEIVAATGLRLVYCLPDNGIAVQDELGCEGLRAARRAFALDSFCDAEILFYDHAFSPSRGDARFHANKIRAFVAEKHYGIYGPALAKAVGR
jgi:hypothetical protein